jgi:hypothetical protein
VVAVAVGAAEDKAVAVRAAEDKVVVAAVGAAEDKVVVGEVPGVDAGARADWDAGRVATVCARNAERPCLTSRVSPVS